MSLLWGVKVFVITFFHTDCWLKHLCNQYRFIFHILCGVRLMQMLWTWCRGQVEKLSSSLDQLLLLDAPSALKLWAQTRDGISHTSTSIQRVVTCAHTQSWLLTTNSFKQIQVESSTYWLQQHPIKNICGFESVQALHYAPLWFLMLSQTHPIHAVHVNILSLCKYRHSSPQPPRVKHAVLLHGAMSMIVVLMETVCVWQRSSNKTFVLICDSDGFQAQRRRGRCLRRLNTTTSYSSKERSQVFVSRCLLLFTQMYIHIRTYTYTCIYINSVMTLMT